MNGRRCLYLIFSITRSADRSIREQQDEAYKASLKADQEKERIARMERESQERIENEAKLAEREKEEKIEVSDHSCIKKKQLKRKLQENLPPEPLHEENITKLSFRLPSGNRIVRVFKNSNLVRHVYEFVETLDLLPLPLESDFLLVIPYPRQELEDMESSLESCKLCPSASLIVEEKL